MALETPKRKVMERTEVSSPELFQSESEDDGNDLGKDIEKTEKDVEAKSIYPKQLSQAELVLQSDAYLLTRITKFLSGVPPPPKHTICQLDCDDFLMYIQQNQRYFWTSSRNGTPSKHSDKQQLHQRAKSTSRNLSNAFDACELSSDSVVSSAKGGIGDPIETETKTDLVTDNREIEHSSKLVVRENNSNNLSSTSNIENKLSKDENSILRYHSTDENTAVTLNWSEAYEHKFHGIHYNRNKSVEDFENLTIKLCERYIGAETQSTCNIWFTKQAPGSVRKRSLLIKRNNGQSPGKRLSHLARRRRTFSSANLQGLSQGDRKQLVLNLKKSMVRKGKSPRGKSPRGKSPRGKSPRGKSPRGTTPRSSTQKRAARRLLLEGPSPRKTKLETSKRALFQSPPSDRAGPSRSSTARISPQKIKRALFLNTQRKEEEGETPTAAVTGGGTGGGRNAEETGGESMKKVILDEPSRKRKNDEELEGPRFKWAKSLSFDCPHSLENRSVNNTWEHERHSTGSFQNKSESSVNHGRCELSDTHRKKLLWAVAEALRSKGIVMGHPRFKQYASNLARTVKKYMPELENKNIPRNPGSTSDRMLKLAKYHLLFVLDTKPNE